MRRGDPRQRGAAPAMRSALLLLVVVLFTGSCRGDTAATTSPMKSVSAGIATTVKPSTVASKSTVSSTGKQTTSITLSHSTASTLVTTVKSVLSATTKGAQQTTLGTTVTPAPAGSAIKGTSVKPSSSSVTDKTTKHTRDTTALRTPTVTSSSTLIGPKGVSPSILSSSDSPGTVTTLSPSPQSKGTSSSLVSTAPSSPNTLTSHRHPTAAGHGSSIVPLGSATTAKEKTTATPKMSIAPATTRPGNMSTKGAVPTTVTKPEGKKENATTQSPLGVAPSTPDLSHGTAGTTRVTSLSPEHHIPFPTSGTNRTSFQAQSKIVCEDAKTSKYQGIVLTFNESRPCNSIENSSLKEPLMNELCRAVKSSFNQSREDCTVRLASIADDPKKLAIIGVSVTTHSVDDELSESLAVKKGELEKLGLSNLTYGEKPMDLDTEDRFGMPLIITIVCMAASLLLVAAIYGCCHQRISRRKDQQRLTEELQTMENGYHDNPTLEVMETSGEMQEKKVNLNGELADSWIVPMDSLTKEDLDEEEDTHL